MIATIRKLVWQFKQTASVFPTFHSTHKEWGLPVAQLIQDVVTWWNSGLEMLKTSNWKKGFCSCIWLSFINITSSVEYYWEQLAWMWEIKINWCTLGLSCASSHAFAESEFSIFKSQSNVRDLHWVPLKQDGFLEQWRSLPNDKSKLALCQWSKNQNYTKCNTSHTKIITIIKSASVN